MSNESDVLTKDVLEIVVKIAVIGVLVVWTFLLIKPFLTPVIWGVILAVLVLLDQTRRSQRLTWFVFSLFCFTATLSAFSDQFITCFQ